MDDQILSLEHISLSYHTMKGETPALCDLTFSVTPGNLLLLSDRAAAERARS